VPLCEELKFIHNTQRSTPDIFGSRMRTDAINSPAPVAVTRLVPTVLGTRALELVDLYAKSSAFNQQTGGFSQSIWAFYKLISVSGWSFPKTLPSLRIH
jgi:hypothetical protein